MGVSPLDRHDDTMRFEELYRATYQDVLAYCRRRVPGEDADDVVSATYVAAWRRLEDVLSADSSHAWLYRAAYRAIGNYRRGAGRLMALRTKLRWAPVPRVVTVADRVQSIEDVARALAALERLALVDQELIRLVVFEELSHIEIAEVVGMSPAAVRTRLYRARAELRRLFNCDEGGAR
jgi:RNA polymerase sigma factor (sigma-70 family)